MKTTTRTSIIFRLVPILLLLAIAWPTFAVKVRATVSAYHSHRRTATGTRPHWGTCAAPRKWLGCYVKIKGVGCFKVTDVCRRGIDIWMPTRKKCLHWGRRTLTVRIEHPRKRHRVVRRRHR